MELKVENLEVTMETVTYQGRKRSEEIVDEKLKGAMAAIEDRVKAAMDAVDEAERIADEHGLSFDFDLAYGMGGSYIPRKANKGAEAAVSAWKKMTAEERKALGLPEFQYQLEEKFGRTDEPAEGFDYHDRAGWVSSSSQC